MSEIYNAEYYKEYDVGCGKVDYSDSEYTKGFLTQIAQKIADDLLREVYALGGQQVGGAPLCK